MNKGNFIEETAGFHINSLNLPTQWEYIHQNRDILLKVDQFGPIYAQANPPGDIMLFKRESGQKYSNWIVWINTENSSFTNFFRPLADNRNPSFEPDNVSIDFNPDFSLYSFEYKELKISTEFFVPQKGTEIIMIFKVKNIGSKTKQLRICPHLIPYVNQAQIAPWDKYEWYLKSGVSNEEKIVFWSQLLSSNGEKSNRRTAVLLTDNSNLSGAEISLEKYIGNGNINCPETALNGDYRIKNIEGKYGEYTEKNTIYGYPPVYALEYEWTLDPYEEKELTQVLSMPAQEDGSMPQFNKVRPLISYFNKSIYIKCKSERNQYFKNLFQTIKVKTGDKAFDYYVNYWLPLQMNWVASLDRGWPTGMRGTRDSAQDYTALLYMDSKSCEEVLLIMLTCQRSDGWFPRQYSAKGRKGNHDLRSHIDGGVFTVEFMWLYLAHTGNYEILNKSLPWLDSENTSTVLEHIIKACEYYIDKENIGEHGLCKIRGGDWLDAVNQAGLLGRGESITVSAQAVLALYYIIDICETTSMFTEKIPYYRENAEKLAENINRYAYNEKGFYNGVFNDNGFWLFSDSDPDGVSRPYGPANYFCIISGVVQQEKYKDMLNIIENLKGPYGYRLFWPPFGEKPIECVGRIASGDVPECLVENGNVYNHGSQGFMARSLSVMGEGEKLFDAIKWIMPYDTKRHPTEEVYTPPYAIVNCYQQIPLYGHRGLMSFLTGSVAMAMRGVYEWMMGIKPQLDGLAIDPCLSKIIEISQINFFYRNKSVELIIHNENNAITKRLVCNGIELFDKRKDKFSNRELFIVHSDKLQHEKNIIEVWI